MTLSQMMLNILERLAEMFPKDGYQSRLETYLRTKSITDAATLDNYIKEFTYNSHKENYK
jgi:urease accessory protein UreF